MKQIWKHLELHEVIMPYLLIKLPVLLQEVHAFGPDDSMMVLGVQYLDQQSSCDVTTR